MSISTDSSTRAGPSYPGTDAHIADQIARDAALAMALQSEEMEPVPMRLDNDSYLALLQRNAPRPYLGTRPYGEHSTETLETQTLAEEWTFARRAGDDDVDAPFRDKGDAERVVKGGCLRTVRSTRGPCGTGVHRRRSWRSLPTD